MVCTYFTSYAQFFNEVAQMRVLAGKGTRSRVGPRPSSTPAGIGLVQKRGLFGCVLDTLRQSPDPSLGPPSPALPGAMLEPRCNSEDRPLSSCCRAPRPRCILPGTEVLSRSSLNTAYWTVGPARPSGSATPYSLVSSPPASPKAVTLWSQRGPRRVTAALSL